MTKVVELTDEELIVYTELTMQRAINRLEEKTGRRVAFVILDHDDNVPGIELTFADEKEHV